MRARKALAAALAAAVVAGCAAAPRERALAFADVGAWTARSAEGPVRIVLLPRDAAALAGGFRAPVPIRLADGTEAGEAIAAELGPDGRMTARARLGEAGERAFAEGARELDASFEAEVRGGVLVPVAVESFRLVPRGRWTR